MRRIYNIIIDRVLAVIATLILTPIVVLKYTILVAIKVLKAIYFIVVEISKTAITITRGLGDRLSVKD